VIRGPDRFAQCAIASHGWPSGACPRADEARRAGQPSHGGGAAGGSNARPPPVLTFVPAHNNMYCVPEDRTHDRRQSAQSLAEGHFPMPQGPQGDKRPADGIGNAVTVMRSAVPIVCAPRVPTHKFRTERGKQSDYTSWMTRGGPPLRGSITARLWVGVALLAGAPQRR
jgi:hypothetical protein